MIKKKIMLKNKKNLFKDTFDKTTTLFVWLFCMPIAIFFKVCFFTISRIIKIFLFVDRKIK